MHEGMINWAQPRSPNADADLACSASHLALVLNPLLRLRSSHTLELETPPSLVDKFQSASA